MISVILSTYNRPDALERVLEGYDRVVGASFEVLVADDGSTPETGELVERLSRQVSFPLVHVWQEDTGFRLAAVRNRTVRQARGEILLFTDGDCIPFPGCLRLHARRCRPGVAHAGGRCLLTRDETQRLLAGDASAEELFAAVAARGEGTRKRLWWKNRLYRVTRLKPRPKLLTANAAVHREDFERVNGFDERFEGWGYEDEDLARRLRRSGVRTSDGTRDCLVLHLFHPVHVSHRPDARAGANYRYFQSGRFLTRPLRGLEPRAIEEVRLRLTGSVPEELRSIRTADESAEVLVQFGGAGSVRQRRRAEVVLRVPAGRRFSSVDAFYRHVVDVLASGDCLSPGGDGPARNPESMKGIPDVMHTYMAALKAHDIEAIADTVSEDLAFVTSARTLDKRQFLEMLRALYTGFPDWCYDHGAPEWRADAIAVRWRQGGTHSGVFALPGIDPVPPTRRQVTIPEHDFYYKVRSGKIVEIRPEPIPGGAPRGILEQIGVEAPPI